MERDYLQLYTHKSISYRKLFAKIARKFTPDIIQKQFNYHQILYLLDQQCPQSHPTNRLIAEELFQQTAENQHTNLHSLIHTYIENLQTAKICLQRHQYQKKILQDQINSLTSRKNTYVYLDIIQASVYSHFSKTPTFTYQINPSSIAPVTVNNTLNPFINNQFTLAFQDVQQFNITFYDSGIQIYKWWFPDMPNLQQGEYMRSIKTQNVEFEVKIKYLPKGKGYQQKQLLLQINKNEKAINLSYIAFEKLCHFQPFLANHQGNGNQPNRDAGRFLDQLIKILPFIGEYVQNLHFCLLIFVIVSCLFSYYSSVEFIDIILAFYGLSLLYDLSIPSTQIHLAIMEMALILSIIKTIWGFQIAPFYNNAAIRQTMVIISLLIKIVLIIIVGICVIQDKQVKIQKLAYFGSKVDKQLKLDTLNQEEDDIWSKSILEYNNF